MQTHSFPFWIRSAVLAAAISLAPAAAVAADSLEAGFQSPPDSAKPQTWWHWMNGNVTKKGITADLEAMKQIGLGGAEIFNADCGIPPGPVKFNSPEWHELFTHAVREANRLGLQIEAHNCAGWSSSGGPWNVASNGMMRVVTSELRVTGPTHFCGRAAGTADEAGLLPRHRRAGVSTPDSETAPKVRPRVVTSATNVEASEPRIENFETKDGDTGGFVDSTSADDRTTGGRRFAARQERLT